jgi:hypothetical protein
VLHGLPFANWGVACTVGAVITINKPAKKIAPIVTRTASDVINCIATLQFA